MFDRLRNQKGSAFLIVIALMITLTLIAMLSVDRASLDVELSYTQLHTQRAFYAADAGIQHAVAVLNDSVEWRTGFYRQPIGDAEYSVVVLDSSVVPGLYDTVFLKAAATAFESVSNIEAKVAPSYDQPFKYAAFGRDSVVLRNTGCTDSYNSDSGSYDDTQLNELGNVGSAGDIVMGNTADVYGDASTSGGEFTLDNSCTIDGDTTSHAPEYDIGMIPQEEFDWARANSDAPGGFVGDYQYNSQTRSLSLDNKNDTLYLKSGVYFFSSITLSQQSSLMAAPGAQVTIYMTDNITLGQGTSVNPDGQPSNFLIYSQGTSLDIGQHSEFRAGFWGPNADIHIEQNTDIYGSLVGASVSVVNSACVHYDRNLLGVQRDTIDRMMIVAWREM